MAFLFLLSDWYLIERAALFHLEFEGIQPFINDNGWMGRLILNLMLMQEGYPPVNVKYSDRRQYYEFFDAYYRDEKAMVEIVTFCIREALQEMLSICEKE